MRITAQKYQKNSLNTEDADLIDLISLLPEPDYRESLETPENVHSNTPENSSSFFRINKPNKKGPRQSPLIIAHNRNNREEHANAVNSERKDTNKNSLLNNSVNKNGNKTQKLKSIPKLTLGLLN